MNKILPVALLLALLAGAAPADASVQADPQFGNGGKVLLRKGMREPNATALLSDGRVVVAQYRRMLALLPSGQVDRSFGEGGAASLLVPPGSADASIVEVLEDSQGRLVVIGTSERKVLVARYSPDGKLDSSFGGGDGFTLTLFNLPPADPGVPPTVFVPPPTNVPQLSVQKATLDSSDRIVVVGQRQSGWQQVKTFWVEAQEPFVARFTAAGEVDPAFGGDGAVQLPGFGWLGQPVPDANGGVYLIGFRPSTVLLHLSAEGTPDPNFGQEGGRPVPRDTERIIGSSGEGLSLGGYLRAGGNNQLLFKRLRPDSALDRSFGRQGAATLRLPRLMTAGFTADPRGGVLVGISQRGGRGRTSGKRPRPPAGLALARLRPNGTLDRSIGREGVVEVPLGADWEVELTDLEVVGSEALLAGGWCNGGDCGGVLAKIDLGGP